MSAKKFLVICLVMFSTCLGVIAQSSKPMTNQDVVEMIKAGLPENTIILAIQKSPTNFDTSSKALIKLKKSGVKPRILDAMINADSGAEKQTNVVRSNPIQINREKEVPDYQNWGVLFLVDGKNRLEMTKNAPKTKSKGSVLVPLYGVKLYHTLDGEASKLIITNPSPAFEIKLSPNTGEYIMRLVKMKKKSGNRRIRYMSTNIVDTYKGGGYDKKDIIPMTVKEIGDSNSLRIYRTVPDQPLKPGEYAIVAGGYYYDFAVREKAR